jgi:hypothetical protein
MNTFWLKIAALIVIVVGLIILVNIFSGPAEPKPKPKTVYDVWQQDDKRLRAEPQQQEVEQIPVEQKTQRPEPPKPQFKELLPEEQAEAERLFEWALTNRKMGRLPGMTAAGYGKMVDACRQIIQKFPGSEFDYKARRMLADISPEHRQRYNITQDEIDLTGFFK